MLGSTDKVQIFAFNLIHHGVHLSKAHNAGNNVGSYHVRRYAVSESAVNHEVSCISQNRRVKSCDIAHQIIEAVACNASCAVEVDTIQALHYLAVIRDLKIRNYRLAVAGYFNVLAVVLAYRNRRINDVRNGHHDLLYLLGKLLFLLLKRFKLIGELLYLSLCLLSLVLLALSHEAANLLGNAVSVGSEGVAALLSLAELCIQLDNLINQRKLAVLELLLDVLLNSVGVLS